MVDEAQEGVDKQKILAEVDKAASAAPAAAEGEAAPPAPPPAMPAGPRGSLLLAHRHEIAAGVMVAVGVVWIVVAAGSPEWLWPFLMALLFGGLGGTILLGKGARHD